MKKLICSYYQWIITNRLDAAQRLPRSAERHLRGCAACREFRALQIEIGRRLSAGAESQRRNPPPFLHARIMAAVKRPSETTAPARKPRLAMAFGAALVVLTVGLFSVPAFRTRPVFTKRSVPPAPSNVQPSTTPSGGNDSSPTFQAVFQWSKSLDQPLEKEMQSVVTDAKTVIQLLSQNFLPEK